MPALTVKNIPEDLYNELKFVAQQHHRSINSEVIVRLKGDSPKSPRKFDTQPPKT